MGLIDSLKSNLPNTPAGRRTEALAHLHDPLPETQGHGTNDPDAIARAKEIFETQPFTDEAYVTELRQDSRTAIKAVIDTATSDPDTIDSFKPAGSIRHVTRSADIARELLYLLKLDPNLITRMCIGDVRAPEFLKKPLSEIFDQAERYHAAIINREGAGYEVGAKGLEIARRIFFRFIDSHYDFSSVDGLQDKLTNQSAITNGGMGALSIIGSAMAHRAMETGRHHRFVYPDNSFGTWKNIVALVSKGREDNHKMVPTKPKNLLHLSADEVEEFYTQNPIPEEGMLETWCITPVGNPSGTKIFPQQLKEAIEAIVKHNPQATIILDSVYIRTLKTRTAKELLKSIINDPQLLDRIIFVESFSKSHGICGEREGIFFTANGALFKRVQKQNMTLFAGPGLYKSALLLALCTASEEANEAFDQLHQFWAAERRGLYAHLMQDQFAHLFERKQPHIIQQQLDDPLGLYIFLKLKPGITFKEVALATHIVGVEENNIAGNTSETGNFIRFSVGTITEPTYSAPEASPQRNIGQALHQIATKLIGYLDKIGSTLR